MGVQNVSITVVLSHCSDPTFTVENVNEITRDSGLCTLTNISQVAMRSNFQIVDKSELGQCMKTTRNFKRLSILRLANSPIPMLEVVTCFLVTKYYG